MSDGDTCCRRCKDEDKKTNAAHWKKDDNECECFADLPSKISIGTKLCSALNVAGYILTTASYLYDSDSDYTAYACRVKSGSNADAQCRKFVKE